MRRALAQNREIIAGAAGGLFAPLAAIAFGIPVLAAVPGAILVYVGLRLALAPRSADKHLPEGLSREVLMSAEVSLAALRRSMRALKTKPVRARFEELHGIATKVAREVEEDPGRLADVRRLLTYYLPAAERLAEGYAILETKFNPSIERVRQLEATIRRLHEVFKDYSDRLATREVEDLDVELKLLEDELRNEERTRLPIEAAAPKA